MNLPRRDFLRGALAAAVSVAVTKTVNGPAKLQAPTYATLTVMSEVWRVVDVTDFGAIEGGEHDNTAAFQNAIDWASSMPNTYVTVPPGTYSIRGTLRGAVRIQTT